MNDWNCSRKGNYMWQDMICEVRPENQTSVSPAEIKTSAHDYIYF